MFAKETLRHVPVTKQPMNGIIHVVAFVSLDKCQSLSATRSPAVSANGMAWHTRLLWRSALISFQVRETVDGLVFRCLQDMHYAFHILQLALFWTFHSFQLLLMQLAWCADGSGAFTWSLRDQGAFDVCSRTTHVTKCMHLHAACASFQQWKETLDISWKYLDIHQYIY